MSEHGETPNTIGRYELLTKFATGGMAELFLARERGVGGMERVVVIKRLLPHLADDSDSRDMFLREGRLVARLNHPNVVQIYELGEQDDSYFLAMEYLHGSTLRELVDLADEQVDQFPLDIAAAIFEQACRGLHAAHELTDMEGNPVELIHRDVSPQNLMITTEGWVKLLDFGVAKAAEGKEATHSGAIKGKYSYMSPEQLHREPLDRRSDIFALGVVMWEVFAGERLFKRDGELETMTAITEEEVPHPRSRNGAIPPDLDDVIMRALSKDREARYPTVEALREELVAAGERHDLMTEQETLAEFLEAMVGDRLEERDETLHHALEHSLTVGERARLRHEGTRAGLPSNSGLEQTSGAMPSTRGNNDQRNAPRDHSSDALTDEAGGVDDPTVAGRPDSRRVDSRARPDDEPTYTATQTDPADGSHVTDDRDDGRNPLFDWQVGLTVGAVLLLAASWAVHTLRPASSAESDDANANSTAAEPVPDGEPLMMGWAPIATPSVLRDEVEPIRLYLQRELDRPVRLKIPDSYETTSRMLRTGQLDIAALPPLLLILTRRANPNVEALATREFDGATEGNGLLLVSADSDYRAFEDLRGATFCFPDRNSTTGHFLPRVYIRSHTDDPESFIGEVHWSGNHLQVLRDLRAGRCDVAATYNGSFLTADQYGIPRGQFRTLVVTGYIPHGTLAANPAMSDTQVKRIRQVLLDFEPAKHAGTEAIGTTLKLTGFSRADDEAYAVLERAVRDHEDLLQYVGLDANSYTGRVEETDGQQGDAGSPDGGGEADAGTKDAE